MYCCELGLGGAARVASGPLGVNETGANIGTLIAAASESLVPRWGVGTGIC